MNLDELSSEQIQKKVKKMKWVLLGFFAFFFGLYIIFQVVDWNEADERIVSQSVFTGERTVIDDAGPYLRAFADKRVYKKNLAVNFSGDDGAIASAVVSPIGVRFLDTTTGDAKGVARMRLPGGDKLLVIDEEFGSQETLISNLVNRAVAENVKASARMMSVEQHYSGGNGQLSQDFYDQLSGGIFVTRQIIETSSAKKNKEGKDLSKQQRVKIEFIEVDGKRKRNKPMLAQYGISVVDASIIDVDYESKVDSRLDRQKQAAADEALARQELKKAQQQAKTEQALGEQRIAKQRAESETIKIKAKIDAEMKKQNAVIAGQQRVEVAAQKALEQNQILKKQKKEAEGLKIIAKARREAKESALDPKYVFDETLKAQVTMEQAKWDNLGKHKMVPDMVMGSSSGKGKDTQLIDLLMADSAMSLQSKLKKLTK